MIGYYLYLLVTLGDQTLAFDMLYDVPFVTSYDCLKAAKRLERLSAQHKADGKGQGKLFCVAKESM